MATSASIASRRLRTQAHPGRLLRYLLIGAGFVIAYVLLDWVSYLHPVSPLGVTPWNPPPGLGLVLLLWCGRRAWPLVFIASIAAELFVRGPPSGLVPVVMAAALLAVTYGTAAEFLLRRGRLDRALATARDVAWLAAALVPATLVAALGYVTIFAAFGEVPEGQWFASVLRYWIGDLNGVLVVAPLILVCRNRLSVGKLRWLTESWKVEVAIQGATIALTLWVIFGLASTDEFKFFYLLFLPIIWIALRHGLIGATLAVAATQVGLILAVQALGYATTTFMEFQVLMLALAATALLLGAVVSERTRAREDLLAQQVALNRALQFAVAGEMTAALAHEVNNPIGALTNYLYALPVLLARAPSADARVIQTIEKALGESRRAGEVIRTLRNLYGSNRPRRATVDVTELCTKVVEQLDAVAKRQTVRLLLTAPRSGLEVLGDHSQLFIVLRNLCDNAITAAARSVGPRDVQLIAEQRGGEVRILVEDTGPGIALTSQELAFAPLASTTPDGMGLGLAIAKRIVDSHGGEIWAERREQGGTRFVVELRGPGGSPSAELGGTK